MINAALQDGWELYGNPYPSEEYILQALVKDEEKKERTREEYNEVLRLLAKAKGH